jgi:hypothetical protein
MTGMALSLSMAGIRATDPRDEAAAFEREVRRIAALLYPDVNGGAAIVQGRERDGLFITEDTVVIIEATTSSEKTKAESDGRKLKSLSDKLAREHPWKAIKAFFVTRGEPTPHQREVIRRIGPPVAAISYATFRARLIDTRAYLDARSDYAFGSARDPETNEFQVKDQYVTLDFVDAVDHRTQYGVAAIADALDAGRRVVLLGDYGAGKSMTLREVYLHFRARHNKNDSARFCIHLNLNQHQGQVDPAEALIRHATSIGFSPAHQLVRAWRSGDAHILLDGFDEIYVPGLASGSRPLAEIRRRSVSLISQFAYETPAEAGVLIAGRQHFFDDLSELRSCLGVPENSLIASATDFTEEQVSEYLRRRKWAAALPDWLPRRPLLVGYLAGHKLFSVVDDLSESDPGTGWHRLLAALSVREARLDAGIDESTVRQIIERLATLARKSSGGLGPLSFEDLVRVFQGLSGHLPDEGAYSVLQRLPGLRVDDNQVNSRQFVDDDLVDACRAGDVYRWIKREGSADGSDFLYAWQNLMGEVGLAVLRYRLEEEGLTVRLVQNALERTYGGPELDGLRADMVRLLLQMGAAPLRPVTIADQHLPSLYLASTADASEITFDGCIIDTMDLSDIESAEMLPTLRECSVRTVEGVAGIDELATNRVIGSEFAMFTESADNMSAILRLNLPDYTRVAMTILQKVFVQSGRSRKANALYRGPMTARQKELIPDVLANLERQGAIRRIRRRDDTFWAPNRGMTKRVRAILDAPATTKDELVAG